MTISLLLADDHNIVREGLRHILALEGNIKVVAEAQNGEEAVALCGEYSPDVVIMDVRMPDMNGVMATSQIKKISPGTRIIALSMHADRRFVRGMLHAGAKGYLLKECLAEELVEAIHTVLKGKRYLSKEISDTVIDDYLEKIVETPFEEPLPHIQLSTREKEVLQLLAEEHNSKTIAYQLGISNKTVDAHRRNIMDKLNIQTVAGLIKFAIREGIIDA